MQVQKKIVSLLLCLCMVFTMLPAGALAEQDGNGEANVPSQFKAEFRLGASIPEEIAGSDARIIAEQMVDSGGFVVEPSHPDFDGYRFLDWSPELSVPVTADTVFEALYQVIDGFTVTVKYITKDDTGAEVALQPEYSASYPSDYFKNGAPIVIPVPARIGEYVTEREDIVLNAAPEGGAAPYTIEYEKAENTAEYTVKHMWEEIDGSYVFDEENDVEQVFGAPGDLVSVTLRTAEGFEEGVYDRTKRVEQDATVEVKYAREVYQISFDGGEGAGYIAPVGRRNGEALGDVDALYPASRLGYKFEGWYTDEAMQTPVSATSEVSGDMTLHAKWSGSTAKYSVRIWKESSVAGKYEYVETITREAEIGSPVSAKIPDISRAIEKIRWYGETREAYYYLDDGDNDGANLYTWNYDGWSHYYQYAYYGNYAQYYFAKADTGLSVNADGTTTVNVYYDRNTYTLTFKKGNTTVKKISAKFGADISSEWPISGNGIGESEKYLYAWNERNDSSSKLIASLDIMPARDATFDAERLNNSKMNYRYFVRNIAGDNYEIYKSVPIDDSGYATEEEDFYEIDGFSREKAKGCGAYYKNGKRISGYPVEIPAGYDWVGDVLHYYKSGKNEYIDFYYTRNKYKLTLMGLKAEQTINDVPYQKLLKELELPDAAALENNKPLGKESYTFGGWFVAPDGGGERADSTSSTLTMPSRNFVLYANWVPPVYTVTFKMDGTTVGTSEVSLNNTVEEIDCTIPTGKELAGWYVEKDGQLSLLPFDFDNTLIVGNITLMAKLNNIVNTRTVTVHYIDKNTREPVAESTEFTGVVGEKRTIYAPVVSGMLPEETKIEDYEIATGDNTVTFEYMPIGDGVRYTVKYTCDGEPIKPEETGLTKDRHLCLTYKAIQGYTAIDYTIDRDISSNPDENIFEFRYNKNPSAKYAVNIYLQKLTGSGFDLAEGSPHEYSAPIGTTVNAPDGLMQQDGFTFVRGNRSGTVLKDGSLSLNLYFERKLCTISFIAGENGSLKQGDVTSFKVRYGTKWSDGVNVPEYNAEPGYTFEKWSPELPDAQDQIKADKEYAANFKYEENLWHFVKYDANFPENSEHSGSAPAEEKYAEGTSVSLADVGDMKVTGYKFAGWQMNGAAAPASFIMQTEDVEITAKWTPKDKYSVVYHYDNLPTDAVEPSGVFTADDKEYYEDEKAIVKANTRVLGGYSFTGWKDGSGKEISVGAKLDNEDAVNGVINLYDSWTRNEGEWFTLSYNENNGTDSPKEQKTENIYIGTEIQLDAALPDGWSGPDNTSFLGWGASKNAETAISAVTMDENETVYALWENDPAVVYHPNGGEGSMDTEYYKKNSSVTAAENGFKAPDGMLFAGWLNEEEEPLKLGDSAPAALIKAGKSVTTSIQNDIELYALWAEDKNDDETPDYLQYTVAYHYNRTGMNDTVGEPTYYNKADEVLPEALSSDGIVWAGHSFTKWTAEQNGGGAAYQPGQSIEGKTSVVLYAQWNAESFTVNYKIRLVDTDGSTVIDEIDGGNTSVDCGAALPAAPADPTETGYKKLSGWKLDNGEAAPETMPAEDITLVFTLQLQAYKLNYKLLNEDGTVKKEYSAATRKYGEKIGDVATDAPDISEDVPDGFETGEWIVEGAYQDMPNKDLTVSKQLVRKSYVLRFTIEGEEYASAERNLKFEDEIVKTQDAPETMVYGESYFAGWDWSNVPTDGKMPAEDVTVPAILKEMEVVTVTASDAKLTYDGTEQEYTAAYSANNASAVLPEGLVPTVKGKEAKTYEMAFKDDAPATLTNDDGTVYYKAEYVSGTLTIEKAILTVSAIGRTIKYGDAKPTSYSYGITGYVNSETVNDISGEPVLSDNAGDKPDAGEYPISVDLSKLSALNYGFEQGEVKYLTVEKALLTISAKPAFMDYGATIPTLEYDIEGFKYSDNKNVLEGEPDLELPVGFSNSSPVGNGYVISASQGSLAEKDGKDNYDFEFENGIMTVSQSGELAIAGKNKKVQYDAKEHRLDLASVNYPDGTSIKYGVTKGTYDLDEPPAYVDAGEYTIYFQAVNENYISSDGKAVLNITQRPLTLKATDASKEYDGTPLESDGVLIASGSLADGDQITAYAKASRDVIHVSDSGAANELSSYKITRNGADVGKNYELGDHQLGTLTITPRSVTLKANSASQPYDDSILQDKGYKVSAGSLASGDTVSQVGISGAQRYVGSSGNMFEYAVIGTTTYKAGETQTGNDYNLILEDGVLEVTRNESNVIRLVANSAKRAYNGQPLTADGWQSFSGTLYKGHHFEVKMAPSSTATNVSAGVVPNIIEEVKIFDGDKDVTDNYSINPAHSDGTLEISPVELTVTATNTSRAYNAANPSFTYSITGFVNGENEKTALSGTPELTTTAGSATSGSYPISAAKGTLAANNGNYTFRFVNGTLSVIPYTPTSDPTDPGSDPTDPTPADPTTDPTEPAQPDTPDAPDAPDAPTAPTAPANPVAPVNPATPENIVDIAPEAVPLAPPAETAADDTVDITDEPVPLAKTHTWALVNLISAALSALLAIAIMFVRRREDEESRYARKQTAYVQSYASEEKKQAKQRFIITKVFGAVMALAGVIVFLLTELPLDNMVYTDKYTVIMVAMLAVHIISAVIGLRKRGDKDDFDDGKTVSAKA